MQNQIQQRPRQKSDRQQDHPHPEDKIHPVLTAGHTLAAEPIPGPGTGKQPAGIDNRGSGKRGREQVNGQGGNCPGVDYHAASLPFSRVSSWSAGSAICGSWLTMTRVRPASFSLCKMLMTIWTAA